MFSVYEAAPQITKAFSAERIGNAIRCATPAVPSRFQRDMAGQSAQGDRGKLP